MAGGLIQIKRTSVAAGALAVFNFTTASGAPGTLVTIQGQGFSTTPASNNQQVQRSAGHGIRPLRSAPPSA